MERPWRHPLRDGWLTDFRVSADGGQSTQVTKPDAENPGHQWPSFLPDGQRFLDHGAATRAVYLGSLESGTTKRLFRSDTNALFAPPGDILFVREVPCSRSAST